MLCGQKGNCYKAISWYYTVAGTSALSLKVAIEFLFCKYALSLSRLRGQGYDGCKVNSMVLKF